MARIVLIPAAGAVNNHININGEHPLQFNDFIDYIERHWRYGLTGLCLFSFTLLCLYIGELLSTSKQGRVGRAAFQHFLYPPCKKESAVVAATVPKVKMLPHPAGCEESMQLPHWGNTEKSNKNAATYPNQKSSRIVRKGTTRELRCVSMRIELLRLAVERVDV
ncbi:MAG: hypothetical protein IJV24_05580, partial [Prevotella sp.]|nr:hypothetical protein [Prevotella sp.]